MEIELSRKMFAMMCSIALFEYSRNHEKDCPGLAEYARFLSDELDIVIEKIKKED